MPSWPLACPSRFTCTWMPTNRWTASKMDLRPNSQTSGRVRRSWTGCTIACIATTSKRTPCWTNCKDWFPPGPGSPSLNPTSSASSGSMNCSTTPLIQATTFGPTSTRCNPVCSGWPSTSMKLSASPMTLWNKVAAGWTPWSAGFPCSCSSPASPSRQV